MNFEWSSREKKLIFLSAVLFFLLVSLLAYLMMKGEDHEPPALTAAEMPPEAPEPAAAERSNGTLPERPEQIWIDLKGAVVKPGVYRISSQARLHEVIGLAGGLRPEAESRAVNLAMSLQDGQMIYVPYKGESLPVDFPAMADQQHADDKINLNTASKEELCELPGIGEVRAQAIIEYRERNGGFRSVEELKEVSGIGEKMFEKVKDKIRVK